MRKAGADAVLSNGGENVAEAGGERVAAMGEKGTEAELAAGKEKSALERTVSWNYGQHALLILEALEANQIEDATKKVTVKGAEPMQKSQGGECEGATVAEVDMNIPMSATTIADSAEAMKALLKQGKIDLSLLSTDIPKTEQKENTTTVAASAAKPGADVEANVTPTTPEEETDLTTEEEREIKRRRSLLLGEWATAAAQIGEGSNAISHAFYDRVAGFAMAANAAHGSLGGITTITDTDRFVLFELTRGAALSGVGLGLQGAVNLNNLADAKIKSAPEENTSTVSAEVAK